MKIGMLASAACAALMGLAAPAEAAPSPELPAAGSYAPSLGQALGAFYASRGGAPLWLRGGDGAAVEELLGALDRAELDGLRDGPAMAAQARTLLGRAQAGDSAALASADRLLSAAWVEYVEALQTPPAGMTYADRRVAPRRDPPATILGRAASSPSLAAYVRTVSAVNPLYARLRDAAWTGLKAGVEVDPRLLASLDHARDISPEGRYVMVDTAGARLYMIDGGRIVDSMKVIVGKAGSATQTPMLASTIYYATLNPYWHVSAELVRSTIARNVLDQGLGYLKTRGYQVMAANPDDDILLDPATVDWHAVADGRETVRVRQLPGPANSMGRIKFGFPNADDIYLHDTPVKAAFAQDDRNLSHGCIRLEDAERLGRWLMGREPQTEAGEPEENVRLAAPVPIYLTYLTAQVDSGRLSFVEDIYGRDSLRQVAALR